MEMENIQKFIVYLTYNIQNRKFYIGVHKTDTPDAFDGYLGCGAYLDKPTTYNKGKTPLHCAILKYGVKNFKRITLKVFDTLEDALDLERWLVSEDFIKRTDTYNATLGGGTPPELKRSVYQFDIKGNFIKLWDSETEIKKFYDSNVSMSDIIKTKRSFAGSFWSFENKIDPSEYKTELNHGFIAQYNLEGVLLNIFKTTTLAAQKLDISRENITTAVFRKKPYSGYYFLKADVDIAEVLSSKYQKSLGKSVLHKYNKETGEFICSYATKVAAKRDNKGVTDYRLKNAVVNKKECGGFLWSYKKANNYFDIEAPESKEAVKIAQYDTEGNLIKIWDSPKECKQQYKSCLRVCQGYLHTTEGYIFKYI